jgi:hypothetical protein
VANRPFPKLAYKFFGPYKIIERIGDVAYKLELPSHSEIHPVFHISQLKPFTPDYTPVYSELPAITDLEATNAVPECVLQRHLVKKGNTVVPQVFVKWSGLSPASATRDDYNGAADKVPAGACLGSSRIFGRGRCHDPRLKAYSVRASTNDEGAVCYFTV